MRCEEIMKQDLQCVSPESSIEEAARTMRNANVGFLPVCDASFKALGTLTDRDIAVRLVAEGRPASTQVREIMSQEVVSCLPEDELELATRLMRENHKSRVLCCDAEGKLKGVISLSDIAQVAEEEGAFTLREVSGREAHP